MKINWLCPQCDKETEVHVDFGKPAQTYGPPENCYPEQPGGIEPEECEHCGAPIDEGDAMDKASQNSRYGDDEEDFDDPGPDFGPELDEPRMWAGMESKEGYQAIVRQTATRLLDEVMDPKRETDRQAKNAKSRAWRADKKKAYGLAKTPGRWDRPPTAKGVRRLLAREKRNGQS